MRVRERMRISVRIMVKVKVTTDGDRYQDMVKMATDGDHQYMVKVTTEVWKRESRRE